MSKHPINDFPMTLHDPLWLVDKCLEEIKPFLITERGRKLEEKLLGIRHLLEAPEDCRDCHYGGLVCVVTPEAIETLGEDFWTKGFGGS